MPPSREALRCEEPRFWYFSMGGGGGGWGGGGLGVGFRVFFMGSRFRAVIFVLVFFSGGGEC